MCSFSTHVLDTVLGAPAAGIHVQLRCQDASGTWQDVGHGVTDDDGRVSQLGAASQAFAPGNYQIHFELETYFQRRGRDAFYPTATIAFRPQDARAHYHIPLLLSNFGYSTYRGS